MSWVTVVWSMIISACFTLAGLHLLIWFKQRTVLGNLLFALSAIATGLFAACEWWMMRSETIAEFGTAVRWLHVPAWMIILTLVAFVRVVLRAGRVWLAWTVIATRTASLVLDFISTPNLNFREITALQHIPFLGEPVSIGVGVTNPWMSLGQASALLFLVFVTDATLAVWRRGDRRQALILGSTISVFAAAAISEAILVFWGILPMPLTVSWFYMGIVLATGYELSRQVLRAGVLADELGESEQRLAAAAEAANLGLWFRDLVRNEIWATDRWRALFGFDKSEPLQLEGILQRLHPDDREAFRQVSAQSLTGAADYEIEFRVILPDDRVRWIDSRARVVRSADGRPLRVHGVSIEITARRLAEERFRLAVEAAPNAMVMVNREGLITMANAEAEAVFNYSRAELLGRSVDILVPERFLAVHSRHRHTFFTAVSARAMNAGREIYGRRKDGSEVPIEVALNPIDTADGPAVLASIFDITVRRRVEAETIEQRNELAHLSRVTMVGELSGSLAHELTQPLTSILINARAGLQLLAREPLKIGQLREIFEDIVAGDKHAGEVIDRLRTMLRKEQVRHSPLDINDVVLDVLKLMRSDLLSRNVTVSTELAADLAPVNGDRIQLQQVLLNLVMNGCDAMDHDSPGDRQLTLRTGGSADGGVIVSVSDRGHGIPPESLEKIFEPFISTKARGVGLGLAVCRSIITAHHGRLWATNNADRGAGIHFTIPAEERSGA
jgi:two-component system sensor kinase FixL